MRRDGTSTNLGSGPGGYGGYSCGNFTITSDITLYICIGGKGKGNLNGSNLVGGYNGGGFVATSASYGATGGGATHIGLMNSLLTEYSSNFSSQLLLVAGGGGGYNNWNSTSGFAGSGGGYNGGDAYDYHVETRRLYGGTQSNGGYGSTSAGDLAGSFGLGGSGTGTSDGGCGGGGGFYGGAGGRVDSGSGGSGYINISKLTNAYMYGYNVSTSSATATKTYTTTNVSSTATSNYAKSGDGYAKITLVN